MTTRQRWGAGGKKPSAETDDTSMNEPISEPAAAAAHDGAPVYSPAVQKPSIEIVTTSKVLDAAIDTRKDTLAATRRILRDLETTKAIETEALDTLHKDLEKMRRMDEDLVTINTTMERAKAQITALARRLVKDGCFKILGVLLLATVAVLVILIVTDSFGHIGSGGGGSNVIVISGGGGDMETNAPATTPTVT